MVGGGHFTQSQRPLSRLADVDASALADGSILYYDATVRKWKTTPSLTWDHANNKLVVSGAGASYTIGDVGFFAMAEIDDGLSNLYSDGYYYDFQIYAYKDYGGGVKVYSANPYEIGSGDNASSQNFYWDLSWTAVPGATGYAILVNEDDYNGIFGQWIDVGNTLGHHYDGLESFTSITPTPPYSSFGTSAQFNGAVEINDTIKNSSGALKFQPNMDAGHPLYFGNPNGFSPYGPFTIFWGTSGNNNAMSVLSNVNAGYGGLVFKPGFGGSGNNTAGIQGADSGLTVVAPIALNGEGGNVAVGKYTASYPLDVNGFINTQGSGYNGIRAIATATALGQFGGNGDGYTYTAFQFFDNQNSITAGNGWEFDMNAPANGIDKSMSFTFHSATYGWRNPTWWLVAPTTATNLGKMGINMNSANAQLHIPAGVATAGFAPVKWNTGTLLTTPEAGAMEFVTDKWYATITTGTARKELTLNDAALTSGRVPFGTTNGRLSDSANMTFASSALTLGVAGSALGALKLTGNTTGTITINGAAIAGTWTFTLPTSGGTNLYPLVTNGSGVSSWAQLDLTAAVTGVLPVANGGTGKSASRRLFTHFADAGNTTTGETDLYSDTVPAGKLATNGDALLAEYGGVYVSSGTATRQIKIYFGGTVIFDSGALTLSLSSAWNIYANVIRVSASVVRYMVSLTTQGAATSAYTAAGELTGLTLANTQVMKITGQAGGVGAATNDIVAKLSLLDYEPI